MTIFDPAIRPARADEYDEIARLWMASWVSTGLDTASPSLLEKLRARVPREIDAGWSLFVAEGGGRLAAMLAIHLPKKNLARSSWHPNIRAARSAGNCLPSREHFCPTKCGCVAPSRMKRHGAGMSGRDSFSNAKTSRLKTT